MTKQPWGEGEVQRVLGLVSVATTIADVEKATGRTRDGIDKKFAASGLHPLTTYLGSSIPSASVAGADVTELDLDDEPTNVMRDTSPIVASRDVSPPPPIEIDHVRARDDSERKAAEKRATLRLVEETRELRKRQDFLDAASRFHEPPRILQRFSDGPAREMTPIVMISDLHVEETVSLDSCAGRNEYSLDIADRRLKRLFQGIIWNVEHHRASGRIIIRDLLLWLGGDLMTGYIHEELVETNALSPIETMLWLMPRLRDGILSVLNALDLDHIEIPCSFGNHGRTTPKTRIQSGAENSFEYLLYHQLAALFANEPRVHFHITASPHQYVDVYGFTLHFHHGDSVRYLGGVGGLGVPLLKAIAPWDNVKRADYHHVGHFHMLSDFGRVLVNGSLIGFGPYSQWIRAQYEPPQQMMYFLDSKRGKTFVTPIWCGEHADKRAA